MVRRFGLHSDSQGADEIKGLPISTDFRNRITELVLLFSIISPWNNPSKSRKLSREISAPELRYS